MTFTRDDWKLTFGMCAAVILGLATLGNVADYGIPASWLPYIRLLALIVGIVSGKLATSPLRGENDPPRDSRISPGALKKIGDKIAQSHP